MESSETDYPAELERIARAAMKLSNPGTVIDANDGIVLREAAALIRRLRAETGKNKGE